MSFQQNHDDLIQLRLPAMAEYYQLDQDNPDISRLSFDERFGLYLSAQISYQYQKRFERNLRVSKIKMTTACVENILYNTERNLQRSVMQPLTLCDWVKRKQNIVFIGATGLGKSYLASALGIEALRKDYRVFYQRLPRLLEMMESARLEGTLSRLRTRISKFHVLILDDWGVAPIEPQGRQDLLEVVEDKTGVGSLIITSQLPIEKWHEYLGEPTIADAIVDRIVHRAHRITLEGESLRKLRKDEPLDD
ncbi:IS21-like element helper ATPase IstB [Kangiella sp. TOML190]|uniref:IS21-like element helper ATPase IstB n=1 Tax=Kangiella sp. TOML190 TaxID=2931351 RepID=UPI00203BC47A|nr:IS21-like element helper ATPase IstB [Kangiella sp. TOML190]